MIPENMFHRFPEQALKNNPKNSIHFGQIPYALFSLEESEGNKTVFLTEHTILFVINGQKRIHLDNEILHIDGNQILFLKRGIYTMSEYIPEGEIFEALLLFVPDSFLKKLLFNHSQPIAPIPQSTYSLFTASDLLHSFKRQYKHYFGQKLSNLQFILEVKLQELFLLLTGSSDGPKLMQFIQSIVRQPLDIEFVVREHLFQPIPIVDLAKLSGRSLAAFKRDFEERFGTSPKQWIHRQRLQQAQLLLANTSHNVTEIAYQCGYESLSHFIRLYKREFGATPSANKKAMI